MTPMTKQNSLLKIRNTPGGTCLTVCANLNNRLVDICECYPHTIDFPCGLTLDEWFDSHAECSFVVAVASSEEF